MHKPKVHRETNRASGVVEFTTYEIVYGSLFLNTEHIGENFPMILPPSNNIIILLSFLPVFLLGKLDFKIVLSCVPAL